MGGDNALVVPVGSVGFPVHQICDHRRDGFAVSAADAVALDSAGGPGRAFFGERTPTAKERDTSSEVRFCRIIVAHRQRVVKKGEKKSTVPPEMGLCSAL